jgi:hypothetical protein
VGAGSLTLADIDATAAYAHGPDAARWLETRPGPSGLVVWEDGSTIVVPPVPSGPAVRLPRGEYVQSLRPDDDGPVPPDDAGRMGMNSRVPHRTRRSPGGPRAGSAR